MKIHIDPDRCQGHTRCFSLAPELYDLDSVGHGVALEGTIPKELEELAMSSAGNCPEGAIVIEK